MLRALCQRRDALRHIVEFIRAGGLETSREHDREIWGEEKRERTLDKSGSSATGAGVPGPGMDEPVSNASVAVDFLKFAGRRVEFFG